MKKPMLIGNTFSLKWTLTKAEDYFKRLYEAIRDDESIRTIAAGALRIGGYDELTYYLLRKYPEHDFKYHKAAKNIVRERLINQALEGKISTAMSIFVLKNRHGFVDKVETTHNIKVEQPLFGDTEDLPPADQTPALEDGIEDAVIVEPPSAEEISDSEENDKKAG